jgi:salicylate hydroxylase
VRTAWRATIDAAAAPATFREPNSNLWLGPKAHLVHYPVANGRMINIVAAIDDSRADQPGTALWSTPGDPAEIRRKLAAWADPIRQLVAVPRAWGTWPLMDRPPLRRWSQGLVTLLGDAAHPMLPFLAQGAAQAIEDAAALGNAVHDHPLDLAAAFQAYETARRPRATRVQAESRRQATIYHLSGPLSAARDLALRLTPPSRLLARYDWLYGT